jgi:hypothetical protein
VHDIALVLSYSVKRSVNGESVRHFKQELILQCVSLNLISGYFSIETNGKGLTGPCFLGTMVFKNLSTTNGAVMHAGKEFDVELRKACLGEEVGVNFVESGRTVF